MNQKVKNIIQFALLGLILIILPAGSWLYLQKGLDYQKSTRADLGNFGKYEVRGLFDVSDEVYSNWRFDDRLKLIFHWHDKAQQDIMLKLHEQFKKSNGLNIIALQDPSMPDVIGAKVHVYQMSLDASEIQKITSAIGAPKEYQEEEHYPYFVLLDQNNEIKRFYDYRKEDEVKRLIEHVAILVPKSGRLNASK